MRQKSNIKSVRIHQRSTDCLNLMEVEIYGPDYHTNRLVPVSHKMDSQFEITSQKIALTVKEMVIFVTANVEAQDTGSKRV